MDYTIKRKGWFPAASQFVDSVSNVSNFPLAYAYALFLAISGHIIGRQAWIRYAMPLYPNFYLCLVGPSGLSHKSTAVHLIMESLGDMQDDIPTIPGVTTTQGLLMAMYNADDGKVLLILDEIASLLQKKKQDFASDLISRLVELYTCPRKAGTYTRHDPIEVDQPFLTLLGNSTIEWLQASLSTSDLMAGFGNRMTFVVGTPRPTKDWPAKPHWENIKWPNLLDFQGECFLDESARDVWGDYYSDFSKKQSATVSPFTRVLAERIPEKILKTALIITAWGGSGSTVIEADAVKRAIDWGDYLYECVEELSPSFEDAEKQIMQAIKGGWNTRNKLFGKLSHAIQPFRIRKALDNLKWLGIIADTDGELRVLKAQQLDKEE